MDKLLRSRFFRCLVCLVLVCCFLVNVSPLKAEASAIVAGATVSAVGVFATLFAMSMGVVFVDLTANLINGLGDSFVDHVTKSTSTDNETEILKVWIEPIQVDLDSGGISQLPPDQDDDTNTWGALAGLFTLPDELKDNFLDWGKSLINGETEVEVEEEVTADVGYVYCNGIQMPEFSDVIKGHIADGYSYVVMYYGGLKKPNFRVALTYGTFSVGGYNKWDYENYLCITNRNVYSDYYYIYGTNSAGVWSLLTKGYDKGAPVQDVCSEGCGILFSSGSITNFADDSVYSDAFGSISDTSTTTVPVLPDTYVGDIPQKVQNGDFDDDQYELPYINPTKLWENQTDAVEALQNVATQLQNGTMTYDQYMEQIQTETSTDPGGSGTGGGSGGSGGSDSGDDSGDDSGEQERPPITDILPYGLDLTDYFPFCIPFDLYDFFTCLDAAPRAPKFHWEIQDLSGGSYAIDIDLSPWDEVAALFRHLQLLLFVVGLAAATRKYIKW